MASASLRVRPITNLSRLAEGGRRPCPRGRRWRTTGRCSYILIHAALSMRNMSAPASICCGSSKFRVTERGWRCCRRRFAGGITPRREPELARRSLARTRVANRCLSAILTPIREHYGCARTVQRRLQYACRANGLSQRRVRKADAGSIAMMPLRDACQSPVSADPFRESDFAHSRLTVEARYR